MALLEWQDIETQLTANGFDVGEIKKELIRGWEFERNTAELAQRQAAGEFQSFDHHPIEGMGECFMKVGLEAYHYWGGREGYDCWKDKKFRKEFIRDNESVRVKSTGHNTSIIRP